MEQVLIRNVISLGLYALVWRPGISPLGNKSAAASVVGVVGLRLLECGVSVYGGQRRRSGKPDYYRAAFRLPGGNFSSRFYMSALQANNTLQCFWQLPEEF